MADVFVWKSCEFEGKWGKWRPRCCLSTRCANAVRVYSITFSPSALSKLRELQEACLFLHIAVPFTRNSFNITSTYNYNFARNHFVFAYFLNWGLTWKFYPTIEKNQISQKNMPGLYVPVKKRRLTSVCCRVKVAMWLGKRQSGRETPRWNIWPWRCLWC